MRFIDENHFQIDECPYFPCHEGIDKEVFNCKHCFCPIYKLENCGGPCSMTNGVKDCSACVKPHERKGHEWIVARITRFSLLADYK